MRHIILSISLFVSSLFYSVAAEYHVDKSDANLVTFISDAPLSDFEGVTQKIDGFLLTKNKDYKNADMYFEVDLNDLDTGIGLRNSHMREDYLITDKWPFAKFEGTVISSKKTSKGYEVIAEGTFEVKGESRKKKITATIAEKGSGLSINTDFIVNLNEHKIEIPSFMGAEVDEDVELVIRFDMKKVN
jgi:polyisoprenoid-binding protein YceI